MLRHIVGIRAEIPGSGLTREGLLLFKANFHAGIHTGNNLSADIRATAWESSHPQLLTTGHFIALQREEIQLQPPEYQSKLP